MVARFGLVRDHRLAIIGLPRLGRCARPYMMMRIDDRKAGLQRLLDNLRAPSLAVHILTPLPFGRTLFEKSRHAFPRILGGEDLLAARVLDRIGIFKRSRADRKSVV